MPFASGSITCRRFAVVGASPKSIDQGVLDALAAHVVTPAEFGVPEELEYGWSGGAHVGDVQFSFERNVFADCLHVAVRIDTNKVPAALVKQFRLEEEEALIAASPSGFINKTQKVEAKESARQRTEDELRTGKHRRSKLISVLWDVPAATIYSPASGDNYQKLGELFERTFEALGLKVQPISAGPFASRELEAHGQRSDYEDAKPTRFIQGPGGEGEYPDYPWVAKGPEPKDFLGNEWLLWLWYQADSRTGIIPTPAGGDVTIYIDRSLDMACAYGQTGKEAFRGDGPSRMPEAMHGLRSGKLPRRAGLIIDFLNDQYALTLDPEAMALAGLKLPEVEEADSPRTLFEARIEQLRDAWAAIDALYLTFLAVRFHEHNWRGECYTIRNWINRAGASAAAESSPS